jgi:hypothetical protein
VLVARSQPLDQLRIAHGLRAYATDGL